MVTDKRVVTELDRVIGRKVQKLRELSGMTQMELGEVIGVTQAFISGIENGKRGVDKKHFKALASALDVDIETLTSADDKSKHELALHQKLTRLFKLSKTEAISVIEQVADACLK